MKLVFFGLPLAALWLLRQGHSLDLAVLSPLRAVGRRRLRQKLGTERVLDALELGGGELEAAVDARRSTLQPELLVSWYWTRRLPQRWLSWPALGAIGAHPSLLPRHRGPDPFFWAIDAGDDESGVTIHRLEEGYDTGAILAQRRLAIGQRDAWQLARALDRPSLLLLSQTVEGLAAGTVSERAQSESEATWAAEPGPDELKVTWSWSSARILRRIRALSPEPALSLELDGVRFSVLAAHPTLNFPNVLAPGELSLVGRPPVAVVLRTGDGAIELIRVRMQETRGIEGSSPSGATQMTYDGPSFARALAWRVPRVLDSSVYSKEEG